MLATLESELHPRLHHEIISHGVVGEVPNGVPTVVRAGVGVWMDVQLS